MVENKPAEFLNKIMGVKVLSQVRNFRLCVYSATTPGGVSLYIQQHTGEEPEQALFPSAVLKPKLLKEANSVSTIRWSLLTITSLTSPLTHPSSLFPLILWI